jgi:hypothetical protein
VQCVWQHDTDELQVVSVPSVVLSEPTPLKRPGRGYPSPASPGADELAPAEVGVCTVGDDADRVGRTGFVRT